MNGVTADTFDPNGTLTLAMLATVLYRAEDEPYVSGTPVFSGTTAGAWYSNAVLWASFNGLVEGYGNGLFGRNDPVTRQQLATILWRYDDGKATGRPVFRIAPPSAATPWQQ